MLNVVLQKNENYSITIDREIEQWRLSYTQGISTDTPCNWVGVHKPW